MPSSRSATSSSKPRARHRPPRGLRGRRHPDGVRPRTPQGDQGREQGQGLGGRGGRRRLPRDRPHPQGRLHPETARRHPVLVNGLLDLEPGPGDTVTRDEIVVLAALCAQHATWLDETTRARVRTAVGALFPPRNDTDVRLLARLGPAALDHLPDPAHVPTKEQARPFIDLINEIGGAEAMSSGTPV